MFPRLSPNYTFMEIIAAFLPAKKNAIAELEGKFTRSTGHKYAFSFRYGRSGLYYLLMAMNRQQDKPYVIIPSYSCVVVAHAVMEAGYTPIFLDNNKESFQPLEQDYINIIERYEGQVVMVVPTHLFGITFETQQLYQTLKDKYPDIFVLQDCAHGFFCRDIQNRLPTEFGDGALYGMNISKLVNSVKGGMLTVQDSELAKKIRALHVKEGKNSTFMQSILARFYVIAAYFAFKPLFYSLVYWLQRNTKILSSQTDYYHEDTISLPCDYKGRMCAFEATIGVMSFNRYEERVRNRSKIAQFYTEMLSKTPFDKFFSSPSYKNEYSWSHFPVLCVDEKFRAYIMQSMESKGFEIGQIVDYSISDMECYKNKGYESSPLAQKTAELIINFPLTLGENFDVNGKSKLTKNMSRFKKALVSTVEKYQEDTLS